MRRKLAAGNWKMNATLADLAQLDAIADGLPGPARDGAVDVLICPPATLIHPAAQRMQGRALTIGAQDCHARTAGAHTGDISAAQLADAGARAVILGHSERRTDHGETSAAVAAKARAALAAGLRAVICLGETLTQREAGEALAVIARQLAHSVPDDAAAQGQLVIAYEPVWAIGTGRIPTPAQIAEVHAAIRAALTARFDAQGGGAVPILYGGSVKPDNADAIFATAEVDGALVGGASLSAADFLPIISALARA